MAGDDHFAMLTGFVSSSEQHRSRFLVTDLPSKQTTRIMAARCIISNGNVKRTPGTTCIQSLILCL